MRQALALFTLCSAGGLLAFSPISLAESRPDQSGQAFRFRLTADPVTLDWNLAHTSFETHIIMNLMEGLVEEDADMAPKPALAERWEISPDGKTYTFFIRPGVKWSDGKPLKAADFEASWLRLLDPKTKSSYASFLFDIEGAEAFHSGKLKDRSRVGIKALSDQKLQIKLKQTVPYFLHIPTFWVTFPIRPDLIKKHGAQWATPGKIATLGPYVLDDWKRGKSITLKRNPSYFASAAMSAEAPQMAVAAIEPGDREARALFDERKIDVLLDATTQDLATQGAKARVAQFPYLATYYLGFNTEKGVTSEPQVRKALALAIASDKASIPSLLQGGQVEAHGWIPPGMPGHGSGIELKGSTFDARQALGRAGYVEGRGFPKLTLWVEKFDGADTMAQFVSKTMREKLGIEVEPRIGSSSDFQQALKTGTAPLFISHWGADFPDPANFFEVFQSTSGTNHPRWKNPEYDKRLIAARATLDLSKRLQTYREAESLLLDEGVAILPLFYRKNAVLLGSRVKTLKITPLNYLFLKTTALNPS